MDTYLMGYASFIFPSVVPANTEPPERRSWAPTVYSSLGKEIYYFLGHEIKIQEAIGHYGGIVWPAVSIKCSTAQQYINLSYQEETICVLCEKVKYKESNGDYELLVMNVIGIGPLQIPGHPNRSTAD